MWKIVLFLILAAKLIFSHLCALVHISSSFGTVWPFLQDDITDFSFLYTHSPFHLLRGGASFSTLWGWPVTAFNYYVPVRWCQPVLNQVFKKTGIPPGFLGTRALGKASHHERSRIPESLPHYRERAMPASSRCSSHFKQGVRHANKSAIWAFYLQQMPLEEELKPQVYGLGELSQLFPAIRVIPAESPPFQIDTRYPWCSLPKLLASKYKGCCFMPLSVNIVCHIKTQTHNMFLSLRLDKLWPLILGRKGQEWEKSMSWDLTKSIRERMWV